MRSSSNNRILTTQAGSLPRPDALIELNRKRQRGKGTDEPTYQGALASAVVDVVRRQRELGVDVPGDGEYGKAIGQRIDYGAWWSYSFQRLGGLELASFGERRRLRPRRSGSPANRLGKARSARAGRGDREPEDAPMTPDLYLLLSENWTLLDPRDIRAQVRMAVEAEEAGFAGVSVSEHVVMGPSACERGLPLNPRDYVMPGNQEPSTPWPSSLVILSAIAAATTRVRLIAGAVISPLRHPLLLAKELATLDLLSDGRLVVLPTASWHRDEYRALGVPFQQRGEILDEQLAVWELLWSGGPVSFAGKHFRFSDVSFEPKAFRPGGPELWFGGDSMHDRLLARLSRYGKGLMPLFAPTRDDMQRVGTALAKAGRSVSEIELIGVIPGRFRDASGLASFDEALEVVPRQLAAGISSFMVKPSQFVGDARRFPEFAREAVARVRALPR